MTVEVNSPLGRKKFAEQAPQKRFTVGSSEDVMEPINESPLQEMQRLRAQAGGESRLSSESKKRIELISGIGRLTKDVLIEGTTFTLRTLKSKETQEATIAGVVQQYKVEEAFETRRQFISRALHKIDGHDLYMVIGSNDLESRLNFVDELDDSVITYLFDEFTKLRNESNAKYSLKTEQDVKEVAEEIKK